LNALLAKVPSTEFKTGDNKITTGEGAKFNVGLATMSGQPVHNPLLVRTLLTASIQQVQKDYGLATQGQVLPSLSAEDIAAIRARNAAAPAVRH
jgi:hypothetical protein